jgi:integrase
MERAQICDLVARLFGAGTMSKRRARGTGEIRKVGGVYKVRYTLNGRRLQERAGTTRQSAVDLLNTRLGQAADGRLHPDAARLTWADLDAIILDEHAQHRSYEKVERHVRRHLRRHFAGERAIAIAYDRLLRFKRERLAEKASPSTVAYELSLIHTGLVVAHKAGRLVTLPPFPSVHIENTRTTFFSPDDFARLVGHLPPAPAAVATFMYWTGWRRNETLTREWRHVDLDRGTICLEPGETKNGQGRTFPYDVLPELTALLERQRAYTETVQRRTGEVVRWVFHREGKRVKSIRQAWRTACKQTGLVGYIPHDFRRSAVRRLEQAGVPRSVAMKLVGHSSEAIYTRYAITNETDLRDGLAKVAALPKARPRRRGLASA